MEFEDYSKTLKITNPSFVGQKGQTISNLCRNLLEGMLEKDINKRLTLEQISNHQWSTTMNFLIEDIKEKFPNNPEKIISELNKINHNIGNTDNVKKIPTQKIIFKVHVEN